MLSVVCSAVATLIYTIVDPVPPNTSRIPTYMYAGQLGDEFELVQ